MELPAWGQGSIIAVISGVVVGGTGYGIKLAVTPTETTEVITESTDEDEGEGEQNDSSDSDDNGDLYSTRDYDTDENYVS
ncbi:hypothetical protein [Candidatus Mycoplasma haematohominis]|uniref:hypothetical protein n=1 Tax=Candidatus Mycoplasma haematohominis TaxID=1494318 RepID=UPI001C0A6B18|nr:hypothetical protein [Candidatus Mycoplasma haemohominis]